MNLLIFLFVIAIIFCMVIGRPIYIYIGLAVIMLAICVLMVIIFTAALFLLLFSKRKKARFVRIDPAYNSERYKCAYYRISGTGDPEETVEYPCIFPEEGVFRKKLYRSDKECTVFLVKRFKRVFDRYAVMTTTLGLFFGLGIGGLLLAMFLF